MRRGQIIRFVKETAILKENLEKAGWVRREMSLSAVSRPRVEEIERMQRRAWLGEGGMRGLENNVRRGMEGG